MPIAGTTLAYAPNTATPVIMVNAASYYACEGGVWFASRSPDGPVGGGDLRAGGGLHHPRELSHPLRHLFLRVWLDDRVRLCRLHARVHGNGRGAGRRGGLWHRILLPAGGGWDDLRELSANLRFWLGHGGGGGGGICFWLLRGLVFELLLRAVLGRLPLHDNLRLQLHACELQLHQLLSHMGTAVHATGSYGYNAYTGTSWGSQHATTYNPYTGTSGQASRGAAYNPYSGNYAAGKQGSWYNPYSGASAQAKSGVTGNAYTGNYVAGKEASGYNPSTGMYGSASKGVTGNAYSGTSSSYSHGVAGNANTGNAVAWNNGNCTPTRTAA